MLVLTRKPGEQIVVGNSIRITVVSIGQGRVKIGVEAPPNVSIDRQEVHDRKLQEPTEGDVEPVVVDVRTPMPALHNRIADRLPGSRPAVAIPRRGVDPRKPR